MVMVLLWSVVYAGRHVCPIIVDRLLRWKRSIALLVKLIAASLLLKRTVAVTAGSVQRLSLLLLRWWMHSMVDRKSLLTGVRPRNDALQEMADGKEKQMKGDSNFVSTETHRTCNVL